MRLVDGVGSLDLANAILIVLYTGFHALGAGPLTRLYIEEILPHKLKVKLSAPNMTDVNTGSCKAVKLPYIGNHLRALSGYAHFCMMDNYYDLIC